MDGMGDYLMTMGKWLLIGLLPVMGWGQRSDTVYQTLKLNLNTSPPFVSSNVQSIGQSQHLAYVRVKNAPAHTCSFANITAFFEGSYDNANFFPLTTGTISSGNFSSGASTGSQLTLFATGLAPYVRFQMQQYDMTNCAYDLYYGGSLYPAYVSKLENTIQEGGYAQQITIQSVAGTYVAISANAGYSVVLYGAWCSNQTAQTITIGVLDNYLGNNDKLILPPTGLPWLITPKGSGLSFTLSASTPITCTFQYRYEQ